jgi:hypothetical protein
MSRHVMRRTYLLIPLVLVLAGCQDTIPPITTGPLEISQPRFSAFPGANGKIAFTDPLGGIGTINPDGTDRLMLTSDGGSPAWSADGSRIAFTSNIDGDNDIYVINADGGGRTQLTFDPSNDALPSWSPDGSKIAFATTRDGQSRIYVMNSDGSNATALTTRIGDGDDNLPAWSPDGASIAFTSTRGAGYSQIYVMNANGTNQTSLTNTSQWELDPRWSPDGNKIAFGHRDNLADRSDLYVMNANGTGVTHLTATPTIDELTPAWSPDGTKVAYISSRDGNLAIYVINPDASSETKIPNSSAGAYLDWQPLPGPTACVFGPELYTRGQGAPANFVENFTATPGSYVVDLDDLASAGADATVKLNGVIIMDGRGTTGEVGPRHYMVTVTLTANNVLQISLRGKKGSVLRVKVCPASTSQCYPNLAAPQLTLQSTTVNGSNVEFQLDVPNYAQFPDAMFAPSPDLPACGLNTSAARAWVDIHDGAGNYLFGFCALYSASSLNDIWFATPVGQWPAEAYITITDRRCNITYTSNRINLAGTL